MVCIYKPKYKKPTVSSALISMSTLQLDLPCGQKHQEQCKQSGSVSCRPGPGKAKWADSRGVVYIYVQMIVWR